VGAAFVQGVEPRRKKGGKPSNRSKNLQSPRSANCPAKKWQQLKGCGVEAVRKKSKNAIMGGKKRKEC